MIRWIDPTLAAMGYLRAADGRYRHIPGLDVIARDLQAAGIRVRWGRPAGGEPACAYWRDGEIVLTPELFEHEPPVLKDVLAHELAHCVCGPCCRRARALQERRYQDVLLPAWFS